MTLAVFATPGIAAGTAASLKGAALYGAVILGALLSLLWKSEIGIYLLTVLLPLQTMRYHLHAFPLGANIVDILLVSSLIGSVLRPATPLPRRPAVLTFLLVLCAFLYLSLWRGAFFLDGQFPLWFNDVRLVDYKNFIVMPLIAFAVTRILRERRQLAIILALSAVTALAVDYSYLKSSADRDFNHYSEDTRDAGPLGYAGENGLASYMTETTACLIPFLALKKRRILTVLLGCVLAANVCCILYSYSREAYLALAVVLCFLAIVRLRWLLVPLLIVAFAWQLILPTAVQERVSMTYSHDEAGEAAQLDASAQERVMLWTDAMNIFRENPVVGTGFLTYTYMHRVGAYRDTHNFYLKMLVETGLIGLLLFIAQLALFWRSGWQLFRKSTDSFLSLFGLGYAALILSAAIVNVFGDRWLFIQVDSNLWIFLGCVLTGSALPLVAPAAAQTRPGPSLRSEGDIFRPALAHTSSHTEAQQWA